MPIDKCIEVLLRCLEAHPGGIEYSKFKQCYADTGEPEGNMAEVFLGMSVRHLIAIEVAKTSLDGREMHVTITNSGRRWLRERPSMSSSASPAEPLA